MTPQKAVTGPASSPTHAKASTRTRATLVPIDAAYVSPSSSALSGFVIGTISQEFWRGARVRQQTTGTDILTALIGLVGRNKRRYGGYVVHVAIVLMFLGFAGEGIKQEKTVKRQKGLSKNDRVKIIRGMFSGRSGVVQEIDAKGALRVLVGTVAVKVAADEVEKT